MIKKSIIFCFIFLSTKLFAAQFSPVVKVFTTPEMLGEQCAEYMVERILINNKNGKKTVFGLATGSTPIPVYQAFKKIVKEKHIDLSNLITFNLDEYVGLSSNHPQSYHYFMFEHLFNDLLYSEKNPTGIRIENIYIPDGSVTQVIDLSLLEQKLLKEKFPKRRNENTLTQEERLWISNMRAEHYEKLLQLYGPVDIQILGIGSNGHIGFSEPGSSFSGVTTIKKLLPSTRQDNSRFFKNIEEVPHYAITMGIKSILKAKKIILLATGQHKAKIIEETLKGKISEKNPASALKLHPNVFVFLDKNAAKFYETKELIIRYHNARIIQNHELKKADLWVSKGKIVEPQSEAHVSIDMKNQIIAPGLIDLQINGGFGYDFSTQSDMMDYIASLLPQYGVTTFLPTIVSSGSKQYRQAIFNFQAKNTLKKGANILGLHLEGPFINVNKRGAHDIKKIQSTLNFQKIKETYGDLKGIKIITLAPELLKGSDVIKKLVNQNIVISLGHSEANFQQALNAFKAGANLTTHLFNAMNPLHHREPGIIGAVLSNQTAFYSIIADEHHLHPETIKLAWHANPSKLILVSDAIAALGLEEGKYLLGDLAVDVKNNGAYLAGTKTLAGSVTSLNKAIQNFQSITNCSLVEAIEAASFHPAKLLGIENSKGTLNIGSDADFIVLDDKAEIYATYISGKLVWQR